MTKDLSKAELKAIERERPEPDEGRNPWPYAVWLFFGFMIGWGSTYMALQAGDGELRGGDRRTLENSGAESIQQDVVYDGSLVYKNICAACHQQNGLGVTGAFPPLAGSEWVTSDDPKLIAKIVLKGLQGPIRVKGLDYNGVMPAFESQLKDGEIAAVANYIRKEWGNSATPDLTANEVTQLRNDSKERDKAWSGEELFTN